MKVFLILLTLLSFILTAVLTDDEVISSATLRLRNRLFGKRKHRMICSADNDENNVKKLREVVKISDFIFTGTVVGIPPKRASRRVKLRKKKKKKVRLEDSNVIAAAPVTEPPPRPQIFLVDVKRVIKTGSDNPLTSNERVTVRVPSEYVSGVELTSDPLLNINCVEFHPILRIHQSTILLARRGNESNVFQLTSYPIAMSLRHLERVDAAVKDSTLKPRPQIVEEPCETTHCTFGSTCVIESDGRTHCKCPTTCSSTYNPVCGTDGTTYNNECYLRRNSCLNQISIRIKHEGECERLDPCLGRVCPFGARCVAALDGDTAECKCPDNCPNLGDHIGSRPVCGSDGLDYKDTCELRKAACVSSTEITVKYQGKCDPCERVECPEPEICQLDADRQPECKCGETCSLEFTPVCGSDGKTYSNDCSLKQEACRTKKPLKIIYRGKCSSGVNPCSSVHCTLGEECVINKYGIARCECPSVCEPVVRPVCGKDSKTYDNECELRRASCLTRTDIQITYTGACGGQGPCSIHTCTHGATCVERSAKPSCECPTCPSEFSPVCGSDGISYGNECKLRLEACQHRRQISVLYLGLCNGCEEKRCEYYSVCESDGTTEAKCVCPQSCDNINGSPVCGSDGKTYINECELRIHSCRTQSLISIAYKAGCDACTGVVCEHGARCEAGICVCPTNCSTTEPAEPVCASNMATYSSECEMMKASCSQSENQTPLAIVFYGDCREKFSVPQTTHHPPLKTNLLEAKTNQSKDREREREKEVCRDIHCDFEASCELGPDGNPRCSCKFDCHNALASAKPVCASDLRIYPSICAMKMEGCQRQEELRLRPLELCEGMEVKPCNGEAPLINPSTKLEYDCGATTSRQDCPVGSYCHHTRHFAKCCRKDLNTLFDNCNESWFGCCPDGKTIAQGPDDEGCPSLCGCNKLGSFGDTCEPETGQCNCKPGVGGVKCDRCMPGFWGLPKISEGHNGCLSCECSPLGSVRDDCEQMTGRCVCKPNVQGQKCTVCNGFGKVLGPNGCVAEDDVTELPLKRWTGDHFTEPESISSPLYKSTRHLLAPDPRLVYNREESSLLTSASLYHLSDNNNRGLSNTGYHAYRPTPATIQITALLGDLCEISADCGVPHSVCLRGSCSCPDEYSETPDRQQCVAHNLNPTPFQRKYEIPSFDGKAYIQLKRLKAYNKLTIEMEFKTYSYDGILMYSQQKADGTGDFVSLAIVNGYVEFRYNLGNGAVVITAPEKVQLKRFHRVIAKRYHRDGILKLDDFEDVGGQSLGTLKSLDLEEDAFLGSVPTQIAKVFENIGTSKGLMGCIRRLKLGRHVSELHIGRDPLIQKVEAVTECGDNPCSNLPCNNSGTCFAVDSERYRCTCPTEFTGDHCETWMNPCLENPCGFASTCEPAAGEGYICHCSPGRTGAHCHLFDLERIESKPCQFSGASYVELPRLENVGRAFTLELWFSSNDLNGLLLYNGQLSGGKGDFIAISLKQGRIVFQFDLGSGPANITSGDAIIPGQWHALKISRLDREGTVQLDDGVVSIGTSGPPLNELNLELSLYIAGIPPGIEVNKEVKAASGFNGSIQRLVVNGLAWGDLCHTGTGFQITPHIGPPCNASCLNGGICLPLLNSFSCRCPPEYSGPNCDTRIVETTSTNAVRFPREFFMEFPNKISKSSNSTNSTNEYVEEEYEELIFEEYDEDMFDSDDTSDFFQERKKSEQINRVEIIFRTRLSDGLILWLGRGKSARADYFSLALVRGFPTLSFSLGRHKSVLTLSSKTWVSDDKWHSVVAHRRKRRGLIQVDDEEPIRGAAGGNASTLYSNGKLFIGGAPLLPAGLAEEYYVGFEGCIESVKIDKTPLSLTSGKIPVQFCLDNDV